MLGNDKRKESKYDWAWQVCFIRWDCLDQCVEKDSVAGFEVSRKGAKTYFQEEQGSDVSEI